MKHIIKAIGLLFLTFWLGSCYIGEGEVSKEQNLVLKIDPDPGTTIARTLGSTYDFQASILSQMPTQGVDILVEFRQDSDNAVVFTQNYFTSTNPLAITITNIPFNEVGTVTVTATSRGRRTNTTSKTFKLVRK